MCGTLHVCWQTKDNVQGQYLVCILYRDILCLASASKVEPVYTIVACIGLVGVRVAEVDNGRGWSLVLYARTPAQANIKTRPTMPHGSVFVEADLRVRSPALRNDHDSLHT